MTKTSGVWFQSGRARGYVDLKIFCFPYAGGMASIYRDWADLLPSTVQVIPVELPGRGSRLSETPFISLSSLTDALAGAMLPLLDEPFAFFGHSMGAVIAFELARYLSRERDREPQILFVSGHRAPQIPDTNPVTYNLPKDEFIAELSKIDGTPKEALEHAELMEVMIPPLRADFQLIQTYEYVAGIPLRCPIAAYGGLQDHHITQDALAPWKELTSSNFELHMLPGNHFFLRSSQAILLGLLARKLREIIAHLRTNNLWA